jgi:hypothetical protein
LRAPNAIKRYSLAEQVKWYNANKNKTA